MALDSARRMMSAAHPDSWTSSKRCSTPFLAAQQVVPAMLQKQRGVILFTGATAGVKPFATSAAFGSAKFAMHGLAHVLAPDGRRMTESGANPSLVRNSLLLGKKQGTSPISVSAESLAHRKCRALSGIFLTIPYLMEQGILKPEQGILRPEQGIFLKQQGSRFHAQ
jgi:NAD(P)-dependent dehydrogenase (short-subunit alcohol dehydrogenase family)